MPSIGVDCEEVGRFREKANDKAFLKKIYTEREVHYCESKPNPEQHLAARFAGKEAVIKALQGLNMEVAFSQIEILNDNKGRPYVKIQNLKNLEVKISLTHTRELAIAFALAEKA